MQGGNTSVYPGILGVGSLTVQDGVTFDRGSTFSASLNGPGENHTLTATGGTPPTVSLDSPTLNAFAPAYTPAPGDLFTIIQGNVHGTFAGLPEGANVRRRHDLGISYNQGVVLAGQEPSETQTSVVNGTGQSVLGQSVTFIASVSGGRGTPAGSVTFEDGSSVLGTATLDASGFATVTSANLGIGEHAITSVYGGDLFYSGSTAPVFYQTVTQASTNMIVTSAANPSVFGQGVTLTADVAAIFPSSAIPTGGMVTFMDGTTELGTAPLILGTASFTTTALALGQHSISASYGGTTNFDGLTEFSGSTSLALNQVVDQSSTITTLVSSANPGVLGQSLTFTAKVAASLPGTGTPTGSVTFEDGSTVLGTAPLDGSGVATFSSNALADGPHSLVAVYSGSASYAPSQSSNLALTVSPFSTTTNRTLALATVERVKIEKLKTGKHKTTEFIAVRFSEALNMGAAQNTGNYSVDTIPRSKKQKSKAVLLASASYNPSTFTVTLTTRKALVLSPPLKLTITAAGLLDALGRPLSTNYVATLTKGGATASHGAARPSQRPIRTDR